MSWRIYPIEYIIAEKIQTLLDRGSANSRAKDVYDLIHLFPRSQNQDALMSAIRNTFENRKTEFPKSFVQQVGQFDKTILSHGWPGVKILEQKPDFEAAWTLLMGFLQNLDERKNL